MTLTPIPWVPPAAVYVPVPSPADLFRYLGWPPPDAEQELSAQAHLERARLMVLSYCRWRGTYGQQLSEELAAVIVSLAGRSLANPTGSARVEAGTFRSSPGQPEFLLGERLVLDAYRRRAC